MRILRVKSALPSPIDCASPESGTSVRDAMKRYKPNLSDDEPLFSARTIESE